MDLHQLRCFVAAAEELHFGRAAQRLDMLPSALGRFVRLLEDDLGTRLMTRTTRSVALTDAGRAFVEQLGPALQAIHGAMATARSQQATPSGMLRINAFATAAREILGPLVLEFLRRHPQVHVDLVTEGRLVDIVAEGFDLGVRRADLVPSDMIAVPLGRPHRHAVVGSPAYFAAHARPRVPPDLLNHPCIRIRLPNGALYRWQFEKRGEAAQIEVRGPITLDEASLARTAALDGIGLGFFMEQDVLADIAAGRLLRVLEDWTPPLAGLCLYYPGRRNPSAALQAFITLARERSARPRP